MKLVLSLFFFHFLQLVLAVPPPALSLRDSLPICGKAAGGKKCPADLCCSVSGFCGKGPEYCDAAKGCQSGCKAIVTPPVCDPTKPGGAFRRVGYYQSYAGFRAEYCNKVRPKDINAPAYTHLVFAFVHFERTNASAGWWFCPSRKDGREEYDLKLLEEFTDLKKENKNLKTWVSIGGGAFNDPSKEKPETWKLWPEIVRDTNRAAWIDSLIKFMTKYKFDGVDLDWEFPGDPVRGGEEGDTENYSKLVKELREAFKAKKLDWGISLAIGIDAQGVNMTAMTPYVDFFNWMSYDLHASSPGPPPGKNLALPHTNITEIAVHLKNLWVEGLKPYQINLGLANYGMSYTAPGCKGPGCPYTGPGKIPPPPKPVPPGQQVYPCGEAGRLTTWEILHLPDADRLTTPDPVSMVKQTLWRMPGEPFEQIVFWDDHETLGAKERWAKERCLGGTMSWSIDQGVQVPKAK